MACNSCAKPFNLLRKEKGCPGCGFSYCSKCLDNKVFLPKLNTEAKVCAKCKRSPPKDEPKKVEPPDAYYKRLGINKESPNRMANDTPSEQDPKDEEIKKRLQKLKEDKIANQAKTSNEDDIAKRLQKLKDVPKTSDAEIMERLARLRGVPANVSQKQENEDLKLTDNLKTQLEQNKMKNLSCDPCSEEVDIPKQFQSLVMAEYKMDKQTIIVLCSQEGKHLLSKLDEFFVDATFKSTPHPYKQLFTLHGNLGSTEVTKIVPLLYALMSDDSKESYFVLYDLIKANVPEWEPKVFYVDFDNRLTDPLKYFFPNVMVKRCYHHFTNSLWRKAKALRIKWRHYRRIVALCTALPLLPREKLEEGFRYVKLESEKPYVKNNRVTAFIRYMEETWMKSDQNMAEWCIYDEYSKVINFAEYWNTTINLEISKNSLTITNLLIALEKDMTNIKELRNFPSEKDLINLILKTQAELLHNEICVGHFLEILR